MTRLSNAQIVLDGEVIAGSVLIEAGRIAAVDPGMTDEGLDFDGDFLTPGLIDLHTDNLERQVQPRSTARWPSRSALMAHDAQCAAAGITTVFDALCLGDSGFEEGRVRTFTEGLADLRAMAGTGLLKAEHFLHLRCELPAPEMPDLLARAIDDPLVRLVSMMDHSPGFGQYADIGRYRRMRQTEGFLESEIDEMLGLMESKRIANHRAGRHLVLDHARARHIPVASHDDRTSEEVAQNYGEGITVSEFPVSLEAARAARERGIRVIAGAANIVRGGSHSGNVAVLDLVRAGLVDALASDYVPSAMMEAAFRCVEAAILSLPEAIALVSAKPAALAGLADRGRIAPGCRADLVRVRVHEGLPVIRAVWREGERVA